MYYLVILQESYNGDKFFLNRAKRNKIWINFNQITKRWRTSSMWPVTIHTQTNDKWHSKSAMTRKENKEIQSKDIHSGHTWAPQVKLVQLLLFWLFFSLLLYLKNSFSHNLSFLLFHTFSRICLLSFSPRNPPLNSHSNPWISENSSTIPSSPSFAQLNLS